MARYKHISVNGINRREHDVVWEQANGPIPKGCVIHHKNGNGKDNRLENLMMLTNEEHLKLHHELRRTGRDPVDSNDPDVIAHREQLKKSGAKYRRTHKAEKAAYDKRFNAEHKDEIAARSKIYRTAHREELNAKQKARYLADHDANLEKMRQYRESHREQIRARDRLCRAIRLGKSEDTISVLRKEYDAVNKKYGFHPRSRLG